MTTFTPTQGRYLSFIHAYRKAFGVAPAHAEIVMALDVTPPSVNNMLKMLEKKQLIARKPGVARAIELLLDPELIPVQDFAAQLRTRHLAKNRNPGRHARRPPLLDSICHGLGKRSYA